MSLHQSASKRNAAKRQEEPIAVVGYSCILPGGENVTESWEMIQQGLDNIAELPDDRVDVTAYYDPNKTTKDKIYCTRGGFIPDFDFDPREFGLNMFQMEDCDVNQTISLLKVKEALNHANVPLNDGKKKNIGCVLGIGGGLKASNEFYSRLNYVVVEKVLRKAGMPADDVAKVVDKYKAHFPEWRLDSFPGFLGNVVAGRICNVFNMDGMNCVVDAACASSLIAVKVAVDELLYGDCDAMVCGATCTDNSVGMYMAFSKTPVFSTKKSCNAYDKSTGGMLIGEGSVMLVLKKLSTAKRDGDTIHALIRGCASSSDGKAPGIYAPTITGQMLAIQRAYDRAGVDPASVTMIEGHGTGTPKGDQIELSALKNVLRDAGTPTQQVAVGSIKTQIGHLKSCAGMAGLIKAILAIKHKTIPKSINCDEPPVLYQDGEESETNLKIQETPIYINTKQRPWFVPHPGMPRRAGISSFGFGGANYHCVIEEAETEHTKPYRESRTSRGVVFSAASNQQLMQTMTTVLQSFEQAKDKKSSLLAFEIAATEHQVRSTIPANHVRLGFVSTDPSHMVEQLNKSIGYLKSNGNKSEWTLPREGVMYQQQASVRGNTKVAALFSGQGSQYVNMFDSVAMNWPTFRNSVVAMDKAGDAICGNTASGAMYPRPSYENEKATKDLQDTKNLASSLLAQPTTVACSVGTYDIFTSAGFTPDFVAGHSLGEISALYAAGALDIDTMSNLVWQRSKAMSIKSTGTAEGGMAAVIGKNADQINLTVNGVWIANMNSPKQVVITGEKRKVEQQSQLLVAQGFKVVALEVGDAFHSEHMAPAANEFAKHVAQANVQAPSKVECFSNVTGQPYPRHDNRAVKDMLTKHMVSSVQFIDQIENMYAKGARVFVEFGPRSTLTRLGEQILAAKNDPTVRFVAVNAAPRKDPTRVDSDFLLRKASVELCMAGVGLKNFDPWSIPDPFVMAAKKKKRKTALRLSAATYVSKGTKKKREKFLNDGWKLSGNVVAKPAASNSNNVHKQEIKKLESELYNKNKEADEQKRIAEQAQKEADSARAEIARLKQAVKDLRNAAPSSSSSSSSAMVVQYETKSKNDLMDRFYESGLLAKLLQQHAGNPMDELMRAPDTRTYESRVVVSNNTPPPQQRQYTAPPQQQRSAPSNSGGAAEATRVVMEVLASKTGYDTEMIEDDMELETELGIDSIKRVEILSEVQSRLNVEAKDIAALSRTRTVGEVIAAMVNEIKGTSNSPQKGNSNAMVVSNGASSGFPNASDISDGCGVTLSFAVPKSIPTPDVLELKNNPVNRPIVVVDDGTNVAIELVKKLGNRAVALVFSPRRSNICSRSVALKNSNETSLTSALSTIESSYGTIGGFIYMDSNNTQPGWCLLAAKHVKESLHKNIQDGRCFFLGVTRMDGQLGLSGNTVTPSATLSESVLGTAERGAIFGLVKTLGLEWPDVYCRGVDLALNIRSDQEAAQYLYNEINDSDRCLREVGYDTNGTRWTTSAPNLRTEKGRRGSQEAEYSPDDVFLVAGGGRGITPVCMAAVARRVGGGTFFLLGRSKVTPEPAWAKGLADNALKKAGIAHLKSIYKQNGNDKRFKPTPKLHKALLKSVDGSRAVNESIAMINNAGGTAYYLTCDACNEQQVAQAVRTVKTDYNLDVTGIVQAAGVLRDKMVHNKKFEDFQLVYNTKIVGLKNLLNHVNRNKLRHVVVFSSLAGFHGNKGQSDYAMANDVLNKAAHVLSTVMPTTRVRALDFGPWDGGMVNAQLKAMFIAGGVEIIPYKEGAQIVAAMLTDSKCIQGLVGNWGLPPSRPINKQHIMKRMVSFEKNTFLSDHQIKTNSVLPMAVAVTSIAERATRLYQGYSLVSILDTQLFAGITINNEITTELKIIELPASTDEKIQLKCTLSTYNHQKKRSAPGYRCTIVLSNKKPTIATLAGPAFQTGDLLSPGRASASFASVGITNNTSNLYNGRVLFHGPTFQDVKGIVAVDANQITVKCRKGQMLKASRHAALGQYSGTEDSVTLDVVMQTFLIWARCERNVAALPTGATQIEYYGSLDEGKDYYITLTGDATMDSSKDATWNASFNVYDETGCVYVKGAASVTLHANLSY